MVDAHFAGDGVGGAVVRAGPGAGGGVTVGADLDAVAVAAEDVLAGVAVTLDGVPGGEEVTVVGAVVGGLEDGELGEEAAGRRLAGDAVLYVISTGEPYVV